MKLAYLGETSVQLWDGRIVSPGEKMEVTDADGSALLERDPELWSNTAPKRKEA